MTFRRTELVRYALIMLIFATFVANAWWGPK
jgi:hypothetical protein